MNDKGHTLSLSLFHDENIVRVHRGTMGVCYVRHERGTPPLARHPTRGPTFVSHDDCGQHVIWLNVYIQQINIYIDTIVDQIPSLVVIYKCVTCEMYHNRKVVNGLTTSESRTRHIKSFLANFLKFSHR